jgi:hypothetical protein
VDDLLLSDVVGELEVRKKINCLSGGALVASWSICVSSASGIVSGPSYQYLSDFSWRNNAQ